MVGVPMPPAYCVLKGRLTPMAKLQPDVNPAGIALSISEKSSTIVEPWSMQNVVPAYQSQLINFDLL